MKISQEKVEEYIKIHEEVHGVVLSAQQVLSYAIPLIQYVRITHEPFLTIKDIKNE